MKNFFNNYKMSLVLLLSIFTGGILGVALGPKARVLEPFGEIFVNLMFTILVPLVFFSVASAIANMSGMKRLGKIMINIGIVFIITAIIAGVLAIIGAMIFNPIKGLDSETIKALFTKSAGEIGGEVEKISLSQRLVNAVTLKDFSGLFSKGNMLQIIIFSILFGLSTALVGEKGIVIKNFLNSATSVMMKMVNIIMYYAPIGLGCYFASVVGQLGTQIVNGYLRVFLLYLGLTLIYYFIFFSLYAYISAGVNGIKVFWKNAIAPTVTALATCSSAATIPVNLESTKKIGVPRDIAETVIPLGVNTHKDGSVIGGVMKIVFLFSLFGKDIYSIEAFLSILVVSIFVGAVMGAIPGGGMIGELLIISVYGFPPEALPIIFIISTIIDAPATVLNSTGNTVSAMLVSRLVEGKKWLEIER